MRCHFHGCRGASRGMRVAGVGYFNRQTREADPFPRHVVPGGLSGEADFLEKVDDVGHDAIELKVLRRIDPRDGFLK